ncbi:MAG: homoserine kinase [Candidatus Diapherotrites archaeon]|nr:homoserine kinase [Candidatus Diapherotrites archaeon]
MDKARAFAPATIANAGPGFDVFGLCLERPGDFVEAKRTSEKGVRISAIKGDNGRLAKDVNRNTAGIAARLVLEQLGLNDVGIEISLEKNMPLGSGLGSSGASAVAAAVAVNALFGNKLKREEMVFACAKAEEAVSGFHADNVAPSLLGGFVLVKSYSPLSAVKIGCLENAFFSVATPDFELPTKKARAVLPKEIPLNEAISNWANTALMVHALHTQNINLFGEAVNDAVVEPRRASLIPGFYDVKKSALEAGALGCSISGAGPSVFCVAENKAVAERAAKAMQEAFYKNGMESGAVVSKMNAKGAAVL